MININVADDAPTNAAPQLEDVSDVTITDTANDDTSFDNPSGTFSVTNSNDAHTFAVTREGVDVVTEGNTFDGISFTHRVDGDYGKLYYNRDTGTWRYIADVSAINALGDTEPSDTYDSFDVVATNITTAQSSNSENFQIQIDGANDAPGNLRFSFGLTGSGDDIVTAKRENDTTIDVYLHASDVDDDDDNRDLTFRVKHEDEEFDTLDFDTMRTSVTGIYGTLDFNEDQNNWVYTLTSDDIDTKSLIHDEMAYDFFEFKAYDDERAGSTIKKFNIKVKGANDKPVLEGYTLNGSADISTFDTVVELYDTASADKTLSKEGSFSAADPDGNGAIRFIVTGGRPNDEKAGYSH